jgi:hypothetical protein
MNQIPQEGEYCGLCPCLQVHGDKNNKCGVYPGKPEGFIHIKRLPICLKRRPIIIERNEEQ